MTHPLNPTGRRWAIVLAGGEGKRLQPLVSSWLGTARPKQFCCFDGDQTLLEDTWTRAALIADPQRVLTVIGPGQRRHMIDAGLGAAPGLVIEQPANLDTAPGIFLAIARVMASEPDATVVVLPSDHWVQPQLAFVDAVCHATDLADALGDRLVLLGAVPEGPEAEYGWIEPGALVRLPGIAGDSHTVVSFHEKPAAELACRYYDAGFLWNTMVLAAPARVLWQLGHLALPRMMARFEGLRQLLRARGEASPLELEDAVLPRLYGQLEPASFSHAVLEGAADSAVVFTMEGVGWSDWGSPERLLRGLAHLERDIPSRASLPIFDTVTA